MADLEGSEIEFNPDIKSAETEFDVKGLNGTGMTMGSVPASGVWVRDFPALPREV